MDPKRRRISAVEDDASLSSMVTSPFGSLTACKFISTLASSTLAVSEILELFVCQDFKLRKYTVDGELVHTYSTKPDVMMVAVALRPVIGLLPTLMTVPQLHAFPPGIVPICTAYVGAIEVLVCRFNKHFVTVLTQDLEHKGDISLDNSVWSLCQLPHGNIGVQHRGGTESVITPDNVVRPVPNSQCRPFAYSCLRVEASGMRVDEWFGVSRSWIQSQWEKAGLLTPDLHRSFHTPTFVTSVLDSAHDICLSIVSVGDSPDAEIGTMSRFVARSIKTGRSVEWRFSGDSRIRFASSIVCSGSYLFVARSIPVDKNSNHGGVFIFKAPSDILASLSA